ncbi:Hypothetical protein ETEE_0099 [Edwardsiella anguillarum ET080813]|uniref:EF-hand domain-containing protein n=1 Tax=Edwardsiella anguillarum ET080813 TaxID=667120 RepID=A0A076LLP6_9GAMM|nr:Hypothetical protein ETEE_0099 [Edwardsiella anguillarum ET080813]
MGRIFINLYDAFHLHTFNDDGTISPTEMESYVMRVMRAPELNAQIASADTAATLRPRLRSAR